MDLPPNDWMWHGEWCSLEDAPPLPVFFSIEIGCHLLCGSSYVKKKSEATLYKIDSPLTVEHCLQCRTTKALNPPNC